MNFLMCNAENTWDLYLYAWQHKPLICITCQVYVLYSVLKFYTREWVCAANIYHEPSTLWNKFISYIERAASLFSMSHLFTDKSCDFSVIVEIASEEIYEGLEIGVLRLPWSEYFQNGLGLHLQMQSLQKYCTVRKMIGHQNPNWLQFAFQFYWKWTSFSICCLKPLHNCTK